MTTDLKPHGAQDVPQASQHLTTLDPGAGYITIINTYTVAPERAEALLSLFERATVKTMRYVPGFVSANFHLSIDRTKFVNYAQWRNREAIAAASADPKVVALISEAAQIADSFTPILYELQQSLAAVSAMIPDTSRTAHLLELMKKGDEAFNSRDFAGIDAVHHPDMVAHITGNAQPIYGREAHSAAMKQMLQIFPDIHVTATSSSSFPPSGMPLCRRSRSASLPRFCLLAPTSA